MWFGDFWGEIVYVISWIGVYFLKCSTMIQRKDTFLHSNIVVSFLFKNYIFAKIMKYDWFYYVIFIIGFLLRICYAYMRYN